MNSCSSLSLGYICSYGSTHTSPLSSTVSSFTCTFSPSFTPFSSSSRCHFQLPIKVSPTKSITTPLCSLSSNDLRPGTTIQMDGSVYRVLEFLHVKPGKGAAFVRTKLRNLTNGGSLEKTFRAGESVQAAQLDKIVMQHTYKDGNEFVFMNMDSYEEERLTEDQIGAETAKYIKEGLDVDVLQFEGKVLSVQVPKTMVLTVAQTDPGVKGNTVQGGSKPATLETGAVINVPLFINEGEQIKVDTIEDKYLGRSNE